MDTLVPAHAGGVDLSVKDEDDKTSEVSPRPCGRGGFKPGQELDEVIRLSVPAHAGGVDLSYQLPEDYFKDTSPRPCGRGGFKR